MAGRPGRGKTEITKNFSKVNDLLPALTDSDILSFRGRDRHTVLSISGDLGIISGHLPEVIPRSPVMARDGPR